MEPFLYTLVVFLVGGLTGGVGDFMLLLIPVWACAISATAYGEGCGLRTASARSAHCHCAVAVVIIGMTDHRLFSSAGCLMSASFESIETAAMVSVPYEFISVTFSGLYLQLG